MKHMTRVNPWFFAPFFMWVIVGFVALCIWDQKTLFHFFNAHHTHEMDALMPHVSQLAEAVSITILSLLPLLAKRLRNGWYFAMAAIVPLVVGLVTRLMKWLWNAPRPMSLYGTEPWFHRLQSWDELFHFSFPSGHTSSAFALFTLLAMVLPHRWQLMGLHFFILAWSVGYSRMYLAAHFFEDVYVGSIVGTVLAFSTAFILEKWRIKKHATLHLFLSAHEEG